MPKKIVKKAAKKTTKKKVVKKDISIWKTKKGTFKVIEKGKGREVSRDEIIKIAKKNKLELQYE